MSEDAVTDNARHIIYFAFKRFGISYFQSVDVENDIAVVCDDALSPNCITTEFIERSLNKRSRHGNNFDREWERP
jgi:hypothetical protein